MEIYLIYGITDCPSCLRAQADLMDLCQEYVFIEMDYSKAYRTIIKQELEWDTFPIIIKIDDQGETRLGGYEELVAHLEGIDDSIPFQ
tara:strand:+ start:455 stop:718 length:264 start_codon:yes stop_codon:yes gene_type:complete